MDDDLFNEARTAPNFTSQVLLLIRHPQVDPEIDLGFDDLGDKRINSITKSSSNSAVLAKIEHVFNHVLNGVENDEKDLEIFLCTRTSRTNSTEYPTECHSSSSSQQGLRRIRFPGTNAEEASRFTIVLRVLELIYEALCNGTVVSKRDLYYRDPVLFSNQRRVDRLIDDIAFTFGVSRSKLNVEAAAKGLIAGAVKLHYIDGSIVSAANDREGMLVPSVQGLLFADISAVKWILVVEKEATFRSIAASTIWNAVKTEGVILTGKGYPDIASRALLRLLSQASPRPKYFPVPLYALTDFDPDGLAIFRVYKYGSAALVHENTNLCVPRLQWLGLHINTAALRGEETHAEQGLMPLSLRDRAKARRMLNDDHDDNLRDMLQTMLMLNLKAELQILDSDPDQNRLVNFLAARLSI